ncbi:MAG: hypothetical protein K2N94_05565 [Lachnospiraceae bacterium]|nr:hypothetical protein [Lachnospiraceae bacterium]
MTEEMLVNLMSELDVSLLEGDYMERDLERKKADRLSMLLRQKGWRREKEEREYCAAAAAQERPESAPGKKKSRRRRIAARSPLTYDWGEAIRTDLGGRLHAGVNTVKRKAAALSGFLYGVLTMAVVALSFFAIVEKKRKVI